MSPVRIASDLEELARLAAEEIVTRAQDSITRRGRFALALSGGSTPEALYRLLAAGGDPPWRERIDWQHTWLFQGDERAVPLDHPDSNFRMQSEALLGRVPLPPAHLMRFQCEGKDPESAACHYESRLCRWFALTPGQWPVFDLVLLGMGPDGHTASLFPGTAALAETERIAVANRVEQLGAWRLTLTAPAINHARAVMFLVAGADKAETLARVLEGPSVPDQLPAQLIRPGSGELLWLVDRAAATRLARARQ